MKPLLPLGMVFVFAAGCGAARTPEMYRDDTKKLLDWKSDDIKACYDGILKTDGKASGKVTITFAFEKKTGELIDAKLDSTNTTAPTAVGRCVLSNLNGIVIKPADRNRGEATWSWNFSAAPAAK